MEEGNKKQINEYDNYLPLANIGRIIKNNLPKDVKLSKSSKETFQECVSEFISFITSEANDKCNVEKRKIIKGEDIIYALNNLGFEKYCPILEAYLDKYKQSQNSNNEINNDELENNEKDEKDEKEKDKINNNEEDKKEKDN